METVLLITPWFTLLCKQKRSAWAQCQTWRVYQIPGDTVIVCVKICNSVSVWIMHSTVFCDANLLPVILQSPQSLMPVCCQSSYRVHNLWCQLVACHPTESTIFDASLLPVILQSPQSLMAACCRSVYIPQIVASHHTVSTIFCDASLLPVIVQSPQSVCCIVLLTLCIIILRSRHDYQKIAPCGIIKVCLFFNWIELLCCRLFAGSSYRDKIVCDASLLPVTQSAQSSVMPACCQSSYRVRSVILMPLLGSHYI